MAKSRNVSNVLKKSNTLFSETDKKVYLLIFLIKTIINNNLIKNEINNFFIIMV